MEYGLIGEKLGHSFSKEIHEQFADYRYELKELKPEELDGFLKEKSFRAINVTIPYKQAVIPYLDEISERAQQIGAVNTIVNRGGKLFGFNTDFAGMAALAEKLGIDMKNKKVLILGTGGTSKTAHAVAESFGATSILHVSRHPEAQKTDPADRFEYISYSVAEEAHADAQVLVNTTPSGMYPNIEEQPIFLSRFLQLEGVIDVIYNPLRTNLVLEAQELEIPAEGGLYMLAAQAVYACGHFLDKEILKDDIETAYKNVRDSKQNLVLCGMPSCGKTTVGNILKDTLSRELIDTDERIVGRIGMEIAAFSALAGEQAFRDIESTVVKDAAKESNVVIATGGGAILREENVRALKRNGILIFIDRPLELLQATPDRPFSSDPEALKQRYEERYELYCQTADLIVDGSGTAEKVAERILKALSEH